MSSSKRVVGLDDVIRALAIREGGGSWASVIEATGFNGATLRPYIAEYLARPESEGGLGRPATSRGDRVDSPYAVVVPVELTTESIDRARKAGMAFYSIAKALGVGEAKIKGLASPELRERKYVGRSVPAPAPKASGIVLRDPAPKAKPATKARSTRAKAAKKPATK